MDTTKTFIFSETMTITSTALFPNPSPPPLFQYWRLEHNENRWLWAHHWLGSAKYKAHRRRRKIANGTWTVAELDKRFPCPGERHGRYGKYGCWCDGGATVPLYGICYLWESVPVLIYHPDGTITIRNDYKKKLINYLSPARVMNWRHYISKHNDDPMRPPWHRGREITERALWHNSDPRTPDRWTKCRQCSGDGNRHSVTWDGSSYKPVVLDGECYTCDGLGKRNYGNRQVPQLLRDIAKTGAFRVDNTGLLIAPNLAKFEFKAVTPYVKLHPGGTFPKKNYGYELLSSSNPNNLSVLGTLYRLIPEINNGAVCPVCNMTKTIADCIIDLNDNHGWTLPQVADWLDTLDANLRFPTPQREEVTQ